MNQQLLLTMIPTDQFYKEIQSIVEKVVQEQQAKHHKPIVETQYLSRHEVCKILRISLPTLHEWTKLSILKSYRLGSRIYYKSSEIDKALVERKYKRG